MNNTLTILHIIITLIAISLIFVQNMNSDEEDGRNILSTSTPTRRGWDKIAFNATFLTSILFLVSAILQAII